MKNAHVVRIFLQIGIAVVFLYAGIASLLMPQNWLAYLPPFLLHTFIPATTVLVLFSIYELLLAVWLLSGKLLVDAALLSALTIVGIMVFNIAALDIVFRDITIFFAALALFALEYKGKLV